MKLRPRFKVGQVVRVEGFYFRISQRRFDPNLCAAWDTGWWYSARHDPKNSCYSEHAIKPLTNREAER